MMATPQTAAARITARPCRCTRDAHPEVTLQSPTPTAGIAYRSPTVPEPNRSAMAGNSAIGIPKNIGFMSIT